MAFDAAAAIIIFFKVELKSARMEVSVEITKSPDFKQIYAIGAIGGHSPYDFRIAFYNDSPRVKVEDGKQVTVMERVMSAEVIMSPAAAKEFVKWLNAHLSDYEKVFGEIKGSAAAASQKQADGGTAQIQGYM